MKVGVTLPVGDHRGGGPAQFPAILAMARRAEEAGLDSVWVFDHLLFRLEDQAESGAWEGWTILSALATATTRVQLGSLVLGMRLRNPGLLAKMASTLDHVSGGRVVLGVGAGWHDPELEAFGYPTDHRVGRFEEGMEVLASLIRTGRADFAGKWTSARDAVLLPPARSDLPIVVAAKSPRMIRAVARYADGWHTAWFSAADDPVLVERMALMDEACRAEGRDPATLVRMIGTRVFLDETDETGVTTTLAGFARAGFSHATVWLEPMTAESIDRLAPAVEALRRG